MAIIKSVNNPIPNGLTLDTFVYPNQYVAYEEKLTDEWIKNTSDYWSTIAYSQYQTNDNVTRNYELLAGVFNFDDYRDDSELDPFIKELSGNLSSDSPRHLKHYPIINPPINTLLGELIKRPSVEKVKAIDQDSKSKYIKTKQDLLQQYFMSEMQTQIAAELAKRGVDVNSEEGQQQAQALTPPEVEDYMRKSYSDISEEWGSKVLSMCKDYFNTSEKSEEGFKDLMVCSKEFHHFELNESKLGFNYEVLNPRVVWYLGHPNIKYTDITYAIGFIDRYDISYIVNKFKLTEEEIQHLHKLQSNNGYGPSPNEKMQGTGIDSIHYNTYNPLAYRQNFLNPGLISPDKTDPLTTTLTFGQYGNSAYEKFIVVKGYFLSKRKIGKRTYFDEMGHPLSMIVAENYVPNMKPKFLPWVKDEEDKTPENLISGELVDWTYVNEWWEFTKIGGDIYKCNPLPFNFCPIVGVINNNKNTVSRSLIDLMKPYQVLYNVCMNQLYELLGKEKGRVMLMSLRHIPKFKDLGGEDALEIWEEQARAAGVIFTDDSPENLKSPSSFNQYTAIDLTRTQEIQSRYQLAAQLKMECWELIGISRERLGQVAATQTATGTNTALSQSYSQTEPWFRAHEHLMQKVYQTMLDVVKWVETNKPESIISHINSDFENIYIKMSTDELNMKDLCVFVTNSGKDMQIFNEIRGLAQPALQNGADFLDIIDLYTTDSRAEMKNIFAKLKTERQQAEQQKQQIEQQKIQAQQEQMQQQLAAQQQQQQLTVENENYNKELDRVNKKEIAIISATGYGKVSSDDMNNNGIQDILEISRLDMEQSTVERQHQIKLNEIMNKKDSDAKKSSLEMDKLALEKQKLKADMQKSKEEAKLEREQMQNDIEVSKIAAKNRAKPTKKK